MDLQVDSLYFVEDDQGLCSLIRRRFKDLEFNLSFFHTAHDLFAALGQEKPDLLFLDLSLPDLSGSQLIIRLTEQCPDLDFVVVTGNEQLNMAIEAMKLGAKDYLVKRSDIVDRLFLVATNLREQRRIKQSLSQTQDQLRQSEERYRLHALNSKDALVGFGPSGNVELWHPAAIRMFGYEENEALGLHITQLMQPDDPSLGLIHEFFRNEARKKGGFQVITKALTKDRNSFDLEVSLSRAVIEGVEICSGLLRNITMRMEAKRRLEHRLLLERKLAEIAARLLRHVDEELPLIEQLGDFAQTAGLSQATIYFFEEERQEHWSNQENHPIHHLRESVDQREMSRMLAGGPVMLSLEESPFLGTLCFLAPLWSNGDLTGVLGFFCEQSDNCLQEGDLFLLGLIAELFQASLEAREKKGRLKESMRRLSRAEEIAHIAHWELDLKKGKLVFSEELVKILALDTPLESMEFSELIEFVSQEDRSRVMQAYRLGTELAEEQNLRITLFDQQGCAKEIQLILQYESNGRNRLFGTMQDITRASVIERRMRQTQKMEAIGTLAGGIAHDFNNLLFSIMGYIDLVRSEFSEEDKHYQYLDRAMAAGLRAKGLVKSLLTFTRQQEGERSAMQVKPLIKETLKLVRSSLPKDQELIEQIDITDEALLIDPAQIRQMLINLCTNATYAMKERGGSIRVDVAPYTIRREDSIKDLPPGEYLLIKVEDQGDGIEPKNFERIFDPFFTTKPPNEGVGLGLSAVLGVVKNHDGAIHCHSEPHKGTSFEVFLPLYHPEERESDLKVPLVRGEHLVVLAEVSMISRLEKMLQERNNYELAVFSELDALLAYLKMTRIPVDLMIADESFFADQGELLAGLEIKRFIFLIDNPSFLDLSPFGDLRYQNLAKPIFKDELFHALGAFLDS